MKRGGQSSRKKTPASSYIAGGVGVVLAVLAFNWLKRDAPPVEILVDSNAQYIRNVTCRSSAHAGNCARVVLDGVFDSATVQNMKSIAGFICIVTFVALKDSAPQSGVWRCAPRWADRPY